MAKCNQLTPLSFRGLTVQFDTLIVLLFNIRYSFSLHWTNSFNDPTPRWPVLDSFAKVNRYQYCQSVFICTNFFTLILLI